MDNLKRAMLFMSIALNVFAGISISLLRSELLKAENRLFEAATINMAIETIVAQNKNLKNQIKFCESERVMVERLLEDRIRAVELSCQQP